MCGEGIPHTTRGEKMTRIVRTRRVPADAALFAVREGLREDYAVGPALLVCVDERASRSGVVRKFCAINSVDGALVVDVASAFEDAWGEVDAA